MKLVALVILLSFVLLLILAIRGPSEDPTRRPVQPVSRSSSDSGVDARAQSPDEGALRRIKLEHASGRFPFMVSSMCRDFLERYPNSPHRAEVEGILKRNQEQILAEESKAGR